MFIIGIGRRTVKNHGKLKTQYCDNCFNKSDFQLHRHIKWITLFFIPIIPYGRDNLIVCPRCGYYERIDDEIFNVLKVALENKEKIKDIPLKQEKDPYLGKNQVQANFIREMNKHKMSKAVKTQ